MTRRNRMDGFFVFERTNQEKHVGEFGERGTREDAEIHEMSGYVSSTLVGLKS
jgi:hypothetical protein